MRRITVLAACFALVFALLMAPYRHVHLATGHEPHGDHDDVSAIVHVHFYGVSGPTSYHQGTNADESDTDHVSRSLDTFVTILPHAAISVSLQPGSPIRLFVAAESFVGVETVPTRSHDPPSLDRTAPRAPPT